MGGTVSPGEVCEMQAEEGETPGGLCGMRAEEGETPGGPCGTRAAEGENPGGPCGTQQRKERTPEDRQGKACQRITPQCAGGSTVLKSGE